MAMEPGSALGQDLAPRRRVFNLRTDPAAAVTTTLSEPGLVAQKISKRSQISRLFAKVHGSQPTKHGSQQHPSTQRSPLLDLPEAALNKILFHILHLPQKISLNFPYSPLPDGCTLHLASTPPPPIFFACKALRRAAQSVLFKDTTFNIVLLSGGPTAHFWLHHNWAGDFVGPKRCVQNALKRVEKVELVIAAPTVDTNIDTSTGDLNSLVRRGVEKEEWDATRKCLALFVAYVQGRKLGKGAVRELGKQIGKQDKTGSLVALRIGEREEGVGRAPLTSLQVVLSKRNPDAFVTNETSQILESLGDIQVHGRVEIELDYRSVLDKDNFVFERCTASAENAFSKDWPDREAIIAHLREIGRNERPTGT